MVDSAEKARETRQRNTEARTALYHEQAEAKRAARLALTKVFQCPDSTPEQVLEAARLLAEISR